MSTPKQKPISFLKNPEDYAMFSVMEDCLLETVTNRVGYEAKLANIESSI